MTEIPWVAGFDQTLALLRDPYRLLSRLARALGSDIFMTRLLLRRTICLRGAAAAELFYASGKLVRRGAGLRRIEKTLIGKGGVQGLDAEEHRQRKALFLSLLAPEPVARLCHLVDKAWMRFLADLPATATVSLYQAARELLMRTACAWAGVPLLENDVARRTREVSALFDYAGAVGPKHWWARLARRRSEAWARGLILDVRAGRLRPEVDTALSRIAFQRDSRERELPLAIAAVELLNLIRPTVAVAVYLVQAVHALHVHPACRPRLLAASANGSPYETWFVQEVRRWYPFFPAAIARVGEEFTWQGFRFPARCRVLLDLYGTNHHEHQWRDPETFDPDRFAGWVDDGFTLIPQGAGDSRQTHRCPGEPLALALMGVTVRRFAAGSYRLPPQDLAIDYGRLPALPRSRLLITAV
jgi:fatty-acid peroxygenase